MSNEVFMALVGAGVVAAGLVAFVVSRMFGGVHGSLANARVGEVYNFDYEQPLHGTSKRVLAKVIEPVATLDDATIQRLNRRSYYRRNDPSFHRTKHLVRCKMPNGDVRHFYTERTSNVRRSIFGRHMFKVAASLL